MAGENRRIGAVAAFPFLLLWFLASTVAYGTACMAICFFHRRLAQYIAVAWCRHLLFMLGIRVIVKGGQKLAPGEPYVFFANHQSALDIPVLYAGLARPLCFIAKKELFMIPFFGWAMAAVGHVSIDRSSARKARESLSSGVKRLEKSSFSLLLFPEGTRSADGALGEFKQGSFSLALDAGVMVVPVAVRKTSERLPKNSLLVNPGPVYLDICDPIVPAGMEKGELAGRVKEAIAGIVTPAAPV
jgi:1-acyl-sn-glycerol-3-phosphate acyltransferase